jgi:hypothetical protein
MQNVIQLLSKLCVFDFMFTGVFRLNILFDKSFYLDYSLYNSFDLDWPVHIDRLYLDLPSDIPGFLELSLEFSDLLAKLVYLRLTWAMHLLCLL